MQAWELKMTNVVKDSFTNIKRPDEHLQNKEKASEMNITHSYGPNRFVSKIPFQNFLTNSSQSSLNQEVDSIDRPNRRIEGNDKNTSNKESELHSYTTDLNSHYGDAKNYLNFFSLPMYGICEKSTQTDLTARDIEDLDHFRKEFSSSMYCLMRNDLKDKTDSFKKLFPFLDDKKISYPFTLAGLNPIRSEIPSPKFDKNFIQIKRKNDSDRKSFKTKAAFTSSTPNIKTHSHIHLKNNKQIRQKRKKKEEADTYTNSNLPQPSSSREDDSSFLQKSISNTKQADSTPFKLINTKKSEKNYNSVNEIVENLKYSNTNPIQSHIDRSLDASKMTLGKKDFNDTEFNISEIINDIKNSTRKELNSIHSQILVKKVTEILNSSQDSNTQVLNVSEKESVSDHMLNEASNGINSNSNAYATTEESCHNRGIYQIKSLHKNKIIKKFDAYYFFKSEFALSKQDISEEDLEKVKSCLI